MSEEPPKTPENPESIEVRFGDIVRVVREDGLLGSVGVIVGLSEHTLFLDDLFVDEDGSQRIIHTSGTHSGNIRVIGHLEDALPKVTTAMREAGKKFNMPESKTQEFIEKMKEEAAKGAVIYTPAKPRTNEEWAVIMEQMKKEHPGFFKDST